MANQDLFFDITKQGTEQEKQQYIISRVGDGGLKSNYNYCLFKWSSI